MTTNTTHESETAEPKSPESMSYQEICEELTWNRQQLEAIAPYSCRELSDRQWDLRDELKRREKEGKAGHS